MSCVGRLCKDNLYLYNSLPLIPTPPLIMAVNIGEAVGCPLPSKPPWVFITSSFNENLLHLSRYFSISLPSSSRFFSWLFCLPSATHVTSFGLDSLVTLSQNHLKIDKIHLVCWVQNIDIKCAGPPNVNFPPFHRFRGWWYLTVTLSLKMMRRGRGWEVSLPILTSWPGRKEG